MINLVISDDAGGTQVLALEGTELTIGRQENCDVRLDERNVSRRHAKLVARGKKWLLQDLESHNGTLLNGKRLSDGEQEVGPGDQISIGDFAILVEVDEEEAAARSAKHTPPPGEVKALPMRLIQLEGPARGAEYPLSSSGLRIGRAEDLEIWINDRSISREHARIDLEQDGDTTRAYVVDLASANGTRVNGKEIARKELQSGDLIALGHVRICFVGEGEEFALPPAGYFPDSYPPAKGRRDKTVLIAVGIMLGALLIAAAIALPSLMEDDEIIFERQQGNRTESLPNAPFDVEQLVYDCQDLIEAGKYRAAKKVAAEALSMDAPGAFECLEAAHRLETKGSNIDDARKLYEAGKIEEAYFVLKELSQEERDSELELYMKVAGQYADDQLGLAQEKLDEKRYNAAIQHATAASRTGVEPYVNHAQELIESASNDTGTNAKAALRPISRRSSRKRRERRRTSRKDTSTQEEQSPTTRSSPSKSAMEMARDCLRKRDNGCVIQTLQGKTKTPGELALLIETYRIEGQVSKMKREMSRFIRKYPKHSKSAGYQSRLAQ